MWNVSRRPQRMIWSPDCNRTYNSNMQLRDDQLGVKGCWMGICRDGGTFDDGPTKHAGSATIRQKHLIECQRLAILRLASQIDSQDVSLPDFVLTASIFKYGKHANITLKRTN